MRRWLLMFLVSVCFMILFPSVAGCAKGGDASSRRRADSGRMSLAAPDASETMRSVDDAHGPTADAGRSVPDASSVDAPVPRSPTRESCNGTDDDLDSRVDEDFLCPLGRMGEICVTSCGVNGYRVCEAPSCSWSVTCQTFDEVCGDTLDNDCDGAVDEGCVPNPSTDWVCDEAMTRIRIDLDASVLGACTEGWTIVLWGAGGAREEYRSSPGRPLEVLIRDDWLGWSAFTAMCGDWSRVHDWSLHEGMLASAAGASVTLDGAHVPVRICYDPGGSLIRPLIPVQCGLPSCPGRAY